MQQTSTSILLPQFLLPGQQGFHLVAQQSASPRALLAQTVRQGVISWRASGDRQISLSASDERAFANFRVKNVVFTGTHFCAVLSMVGERVFVNFRKFVN